ncbi:unnamed protein product [Pedinophyceae sp. YPF-701]|nr:unnamed protein product [Pedinophyceae sp. YPF-701]
MDDGTVQRCYRDLTAVFYFTPAWERAWGGLFRDLEHGARAADSNPRRRKRGGLRAVSDTVPPRTGPTAREVVPEFNSAVFFRVPHWHEVTAVRAPAGTKRFSVFGWWLTEERLYHLNLGGSTSY